MLCEDSAEIQGIVVTDDGSDFRYIIIRAFQQTDCVVNPDVQDVLHGRLAGNLLEIAQEPADAHIPGKCIFLNIDILVVMLLEVASGNTHFFLDVRAYSRPLVQAAALYQNKNLLKVHGKQLLISNTAGLQLRDHLLK